MVSWRAIYLLYEQMRHCLLLSGCEKKPAEPHDAIPPNLVELLLPLLTHLGPEEELQEYGDDKEAKDSPPEDNPIVDIPPDIPPPRPVPHYLRFLYSMCVLDFKLIF